ncbi:unnamed protein product [Hapterophycus canaliculatus]
MNNWIATRDKVRSGTIGALNVPAGYDRDNVSPVGDTEDGVGEQIEQEGPEWEGDEA